MSRYVYTVANVGGGEWSGRVPTKAQAMRLAFGQAVALGDQCKSVTVRNAALEPLARWVWSVEGKRIIRVVV